MGLADILALIDATAGGDHVIRFAAQLARQRSGYVSGLVVGWRPSALEMAASYVDAPIQQWMEEIQKYLEADVQTVKTRFEQDPTAGRVEGLVLEANGARSAIGMRARHADLSIVSRPRWVAAETTILLEAALLGSGRPVIAVPPTWETSEIGRKILVCWKPTREAARALADAGPMIQTADRVVVVTVDARREETGYGEAPGVDICAHLARAGATVELVNVASGGRAEAEAIQDQGLAVGADLIVMGGYGHSRMQEFIFGGMTRAMLSESALPIFMSH